MNFEQQLQLGMQHLRNNDTTIGHLIDEFGMPTFRPHDDYYQQLVRSIVGQQLSVKAAAAINSRFVESFGHFPTPEEIIARPFDELKAVGLSGMKTKYILDLAQHIYDGSLGLESLNTMSNQQIVDELTQIKGIGVWTVHMFLLFAMGRLDVLAIGDLGVRNALSKLYNFDYVVKDAEINTLSEKNNWHPYESLVCWYAWQSLNNAPS